MPFGVAEVINALGLNPNIADPVTKGVINVAQRVSDAGGSLQDGINAAQSWLSSQSLPSVSSGGDSSSAPTGSGSGGLVGRFVNEASNYVGTPSGTSTTASNPGASTLAILAQNGYGPADARTLLDAANKGNATAIKLLASMGIQPYANYQAAANASASGSGGSAAVWTPLDDANLAKIGLQNRQIGALFDPNYADGALVPLPDGTSRINGTEIIIDGREKGQYKPVANAPGYLVDPVTGNVIDTNGNVIARDQLNETIRSNRVGEQQNASWIANDIYGTDVTAELGRGRLALDTVTDVGGLNLDAAKAENQFALTNGLTTNQINEQAFKDTGDLNIGATNAETGRYNANTQRAQAGGNLALNNQQLQDARTQAVIALMAHPEDIVQREYASRALNAPAGSTNPAFRDDPRISAFIDQLATQPNVDNLLPTYQQPHFDPVTLPNASLPRVTAPAPQPQATRGSTSAISTPTTDINGAAYTGTVAPADQAASDNFRQAGVPDWALAPLGYADGTAGTKETQFVTGDPQADGGPNPEMNIVHNPGPDTSVEVKPLRDMVSSSGVLQPDQVIKGSEMNQSGQSKSPLGKLLADILIEISNQWGPEGGDAAYAYGTDGNNYTATNPYAGDSNIPQSVGSGVTNAFGAVDRLNTARAGATGTPPAVTTQPQQSNTQSNNQVMNFPGTTNLYGAAGGSPFNLQDFMNHIRQRYMNRYMPQQPQAGINPQWNNSGMSYYAYGTDKSKNVKSKIPPKPTTGDVRNKNNSIFNLIDAAGGLEVKDIPLVLAHILAGRMIKPSQSWLEGDKPTSLGPQNKPNILPNSPWSSQDWERDTAQFAYGTDYNPVPGNANLDSSGNYTGARDSQGNPLGNLTTYDNSAYQNLPGVKYAQNAGNASQYNTLGTGLISGAFGTKLPDVGGLNYSQLLNLQRDPSSWGALSSLYSSANRDLAGIFNRVQDRAPVGQVTDRSMVRTI